MRPSLLRSLVPRRAMWAVLLLALHGPVALSGNGLHALFDQAHGSASCCGLGSETAGTLGSKLTAAVDSGDCPICQFHTQGQWLGASPSMASGWVEGETVPPSVPEAAPAEVWGIAPPRAPPVL